MKKRKLDEMNAKEKKTLRAFPLDEPIALSELARRAFPGVGAKSKTRGNSWVRNSLRFLLRCKAVKQVARGLYLKLPTATAKKAPTRSAKKTTPKSTPTSGPIPMNGTSSSKPAEAVL